MFLVPLSRRDFGFFDRQRDLFRDWLDVFDEDWRATDFETSQSRFDQELARVRREMHQLQRIAGDTNRQLEIENPFVTDPEGNKKLSLRFDCSKYKPEEVEVKVNDNNLTVNAKHEEEGDGKKIHREFHRQYLLPDSVDKDKLKAQLTEDGVLSIEAPVPQLSVEAPKEHLIPITKM